MTPAEISQAAQALFAAEKSHKQVGLLTRALGMRTVFPLHQSAMTISETNQTPVRVSVAILARAIRL